MNDTAHSARFGSDATWARASTTPPRPPAATAVEMVVTWFQDRATIASTTTRPAPSSTRGAERARAAPRGARVSGSHGEPEPRPEHVGVVVGDRPQGEDERQQRHDHHGQHERERA